ncbi:protein ALP1-like isoform X2 [Salvia splendens]|uniref:protein ALP1-like isoform X2 n=1 Tax=Salvia splendens TaxID=180675 RepID=UPI001C25290C|nr:protein ALP1-like isoform X2 [Salvia splendens]
MVGVGYRLGCLGALDGTHISILVSNSDKLRYRTRKGTIATNVLAACDRDMQFVYILPGWEGSAGDSRVLRDAVSRNNGFRVPQGCYYLGDNAYANSPGFLTPYKGVRYHLKEWGVGDQAPQEPKEIFNMRHSKARNVIERAFAVLKMRWGILRSPSFYPIQTQISKCCNASENLMAFPSACVARGRWCCVVQVNKQLTRVGITSNARKISTTLDHLCGVMSTSEGGMKGLHSMSVKPLHDWARIWLMHPLDQPLPPDVTTVAPSMQKEMCVTSY